MYLPVDSSGWGGNFENYVVEKKVIRIFRRLGQIYKSLWPVEQRKTNLLLNLERDLYFMHRSDPPANLMLVAYSNPTTFHTYLLYVKFVRLSVSTKKNIIKAVKLRNK